MESTKLYEVVLQSPLGTQMYREVLAHHPYETTDDGWVKFWHHGELVHAFNKDFVLEVRIMQTEEE